MYPFPNRLRWIAAGRQGHLVAAYHGRARHDVDAVVTKRIRSLVRLGLFRTVAVVLLSIGVIATGVAFIGKVLPQANDLDPFFTRAAAISGSFTGALTAVVFVLSYLLGLIEMDILAIQAFGIKSGKNKKIH